MDEGAGIGDIGLHGMERQTGIIGDFSVENRIALLRDQTLNGNFYAENLLGCFRDRRNECFQAAAKRLKVRRLRGDGHKVGDGVNLLAVEVGCDDVIALF